MALVEVAFDEFDDINNSNLEDHTPDLGILGWGYTGGGAGWFVRDPGRAQRQSGGGEWVRSTADLAVGVLDTSGPFRIESDIVRGAVDDTLISGFVGFFLRGSGGIDGEGVWIGFVRTDASNVNLTARRRDSSMIVEDLTWATGFSLPPNRRFRVDVAADGVTLTLTLFDLFTYDNPVGFGDVVLTADIRDADHRRVGVSGGTVGSGVTDNYSIHLFQDAALLNAWSPGCNTPPLGGTTWAPST